MALTDNQKRLDTLYRKNFGEDRGASFGTKGGASYWLDTHKPQTDADWDNIDRMLAGSDEGKKFAASGISRVGGIDSTKSIASQSGWADHFKKDGKFENQNAAGAAQAIADDIGFTPQEAYFNNSVGGVGGGDGGSDGDAKLPADGWWNQFADADAFKKFLQGDAKEETKSDGMGDFMKFMMLMNVMGGGRGGGGGYGGSQFGYGGMSPGGVQAAYDPMKQLQGMGTWFKDNFGSGSASTGTINT